jgi:hypothetical protein
VCAGAHCGDLKAQPEAARRDEHCLAGAGLLQPLAEKRGGEAQHGDSNGKYVADLLQVPLQAVRAMQRQKRVFEDAEGVHLADRQMNREGSWRHQPAAETRCGNGVRAIEK